MTKKPKYARDKLKKYTTHLGSGSSRNNASRGILVNGSIPTTYKRSKWGSIFSHFPIIFINSCQFFPLVDTSNQDINFKLGMKENQKVEEKKKLVKRRYHTLEIDPRLQVE